MTEFVYLHGFASSPASIKATGFQKKFSAIGVPLAVPDLEGGDFENLTISRQIAIVQECLNKFPGKQFGLIGSSMGGYLASLTAQIRNDVSALYLMAPGFNFLKRWQEKVHYDPEDPEKSPRLIRVFHYRYNEERNLNTALFKDAEKWNRVGFERKLPTRIVHGIHDDTVPVAESRLFVQTHSWSRLEELDSDHGLISHLDWITEDCVEFFRSEGFL